MHRSTVSVLMERLRSTRGGGALASGGQTGIPPCTTVETATVTSVYPSQSYTLLNATGYVVPQRKAAVASKAQGRVEWLGVLEGTVVKEGQVIARLESADVAAALAQAQAQVKVAQANLQLQRAELENAAANLKRSLVLAPHGAISAEQYDADRARYDKATASITSAVALSPMRACNAASTSARAGSCGAPRRSSIACSARSDKAPCTPSSLSPP